MTDDLRFSLWLALAGATLSLPVSAQVADVRSLKPGDTFQEGPALPEMVVIPAGTFLMGSPDSEEDRAYNEGPLRTVTIARPFAVGKFEVTFDEWDACVADGGCHTIETSWTRGRRPAINVFWTDAKEYVAWLNNKLGLAPGNGYRLLTEAEWEYAARGGANAKDGGRLRYWWGNEASHEYANFGADPATACCGGLKQGKDQWVNTAPVGQFPANPFGLYDLHGNVLEWVEDCYKDSYNGAPVDGSAVTSANCEKRVVRGGSWWYDGGTSASRGGAAHWDRSMGGSFSSSGTDYGAGFRVARTL